MSAVLLQAAVDLIRDHFTKQEVATVDRYGGEFNAAEVERLSFASPAVLVTVLGWRPPTERSRLRGRHARAVRLAAFVVSKKAARSERMAEAMTLASRLGVLLRTWVPRATLPIHVAALQDAPSAENLYTAAIDKQGLALWLVDWWQDAEPKPGDGAELFDLVRVDIHDTTHQGAAPAPVPGPTGLVVTEQVDFKNL